eukprot:scaffold11565_cov143-Skeletonema_marinoi.AAC.4
MLCNEVLESLAVGLAPKSETGQKSCTWKVSPVLTFAILEMKLHRVILQIQCLASSRQRSCRCFNCGEQHRLNDCPKERRTRHASRKRRSLKRGKGKGGSGGRSGGGIPERDLNGDTAEVIQARRRIGESTKRMFSSSALNECNQYGGTTPRFGAKFKSGWALGRFLICQLNCQLLSYTRTDYLVRIALPLSN